MKTLFCTLSGLIVLTTCSVDSNAKTFSMADMPNQVQQLQNADSFSIECRNDHSGVVDRETVDVDSATVTIETPGYNPIVNRITNFIVSRSTSVDRFGQRNMEAHLIMVSWGGSTRLFITNGRWLSSHGGNDLWSCAN
jgi:hypothetical protein